MAVVWLRCRECNTGIFLLVDIPDVVLVPCCFISFIKRISFCFESSNSRNTFFFLLHIFTFTRRCG